jgi:hypothetical protein
MTYTFEFLKQFHNKQVDFNFERSPDVQESYDDHRRYLTKNNIDINDHIKKHVLQDNEYVLARNPYYYDVEDNISHNLLWSKHNLELNKIKEILDKLITIDYIIFENIIHQKTVKHIPHYHVFVL